MSIVPDSVRRSARSRSDLLSIPGVRTPSNSRLVPVAFAVAAVGLQIAYPLVAGDARNALTVVTVLVFAAAGVAHAAIHRGGAFALRLVAAAAGVGLAAELLGVHTGVPFGRYAYAGTLGPTVGGVPLVIPVAWLMMAYPAAVMGRRVAGSAPAAVLVAAFALAAWDLFLDPQMVAAGHWVWEQSGPSLLGIPVVNHLGWLGTALVMQALIVPAMPPAADDAVPVALYVWTWVGSVTAHAIWFDLPGSAVTGGLAMGAVVGAWLIARRR